MRKIISAEPLQDYRVKIRFSDGLEGIVDLSDLVGKGVFQSWINQQEFAKVSINDETHTLTWPGGIDLCPDSLYEEIQAKKTKDESVSV